MAPFLEEALEFGTAFAGQFSRSYSMFSVEIGAFLLLALVLHRKNLTGLVMRLWPSGARVNSLCLLVEFTLLMPLLGVLLAWMRDMSSSLPVGWRVDELTHLPDWLLFIVVAILADGISYWRHRFEHTRWLWRIHALHHSDRELTWFSAYRQHPLNRLNATIIDIGVLLLLGVPMWAVLANSLFRHYYGLMTHANVSWTFGALGKVFVSPAMHRWHHVMEGEGVGKNFATVFAFFDRAFGTYYVPSACTQRTGLVEPGHDRFWWQLWWPFEAVINACAVTICRVKTRSRLLLK